MSAIISLEIVSGTPYNTKHAFSFFFNVCHHQLRQFLGLPTAQNTLLVSSLMSVIISLEMVSGTHYNTSYAFSFLFLVDVCHVWSQVSLAGVATSIIFVRTKVLSWQKYACRNKSFVVTSLHLSRQTCVGHDKSKFVTTKHVFCRDKSMLSWQLFCCDKHVFVVTKMVLVAAPTNDTQAGVSPMILPPTSPNIFISLFDVRHNQLLDGLRQSYNTKQVFISLFDVRHNQLLDGLRQSYNTKQVSISLWCPPWSALRWFQAVL